MKKRTFWLGAVLVAALALLVWQHFAAKSPSPPAPPATKGGAPASEGPPAAGAPAPDFAVPGLDGKELRLSDFRGKAVLLNFWATWCPPCREEMPFLENFYKAHQAEGLVLVAVNVMQRDSRESVAKYAADMGLTFPIGLDESYAAGQKYGVRFLPTSYLIDRQGMIVATKVGAFTKQELESYWEKLKK